MSDTTDTDAMISRLNKLTAAGATLAAELAEWLDDDSEISGADFIQDMSRALADYRSATSALADAKAEPIEDRRYRATLSVNVLCTAEITVEVKASSIAQARYRAQGMARHSAEQRWTFDEGREFDWGCLNVDSIEPI